MGRIYGDQPVFRQAGAKQSLQMLVAVFFEKFLTDTLVKSQVQCPGGLIDGLRKGQSMGEFELAYCPAMLPLKSKSLELSKIAFSKFIELFKNQFFVFGQVRIKAFYPVVKNKTHFLIETFE